MFTINWKTYRVSKWGRILPDYISYWISAWFLEEVKENQKTLDIDKKLTEQFIKDNVACTPCEMWKPNSILEKLRLFLDRKQTDITEIASQYWWSTDLSVKSAILSDIAFFLTSLEQPKEEPQPQFTPWQMIEVSNDGEKWGDRPLEFKWMNKHGQYETWDYFEWKNNRMFFSFWNHARPLPQEDIELPSEIISRKSEEIHNTYTRLSYEECDIKAIKEFLDEELNQLIKANNK